MDYVSQYKGKQIDDAVGKSSELVMAVQELDANKVDKVSGKDLSTNDFTDELLEKLNNISISYDSTSESISLTL